MSFYKLLILDFANLIMLIASDLSRTLYGNLYVLSTTSDVGLYYMKDVKSSCRDCSIYGDNGYLGRYTA